MGGSGRGGTGKSGFIAALLLTGFIELQTEALAQANTFRITEFMALNTTTVQDEAGDYDDWVEITNASDEILDLRGHFLTDEFSNPTRWRLSGPNDGPILMAPGSILLLWLDGEPHQGAFHGPLRLSSDGEMLGLFAPDGITAVDTLTFARQHADISYGRIEDTWGYLTNPTPGTPNVGPPLGPPCPTPGLSPLSGFYPTPIQVTLDVHADTRVFYTVDGSVPDRYESAEVQPGQSLVFSSTTALRARSFCDGRLPGDEIVATFVARHTPLDAVVSIVTDPHHLFDPESGIYVEGNPPPGDPPNYMQDWEIPATVQILNPQGDLVVDQMLGLRISGGGSRRLPKKSFLLRARSRYGSGQIGAALFADKPGLDTFDGLILRANAQSWYRWKNDFIYEVNARTGRNVDMQAYTPADVYINGAYWGVYSLTERKNASFIASNHGVEGPIDLLVGSVAESNIVEGDKRAYYALHDFISSDAFLEPGGYEEFERRVDLDSFIDFWIFDILSGRLDVINNVRYWRPREPDGRWRWITFDFENASWKCDGKFEEALQESPFRNVYLLGWVMRDDRFRERFINRTLDLLNTVLHADSLSMLAGAMAGRLEEAMPHDAGRWEYFQIPFTLASGRWASDLDTVQARLRAAPACIRSGLETFLDSGVPNAVHLSVEGKGRVNVNTLTITENPWTGAYASNVPVTFEPIPDPGYRFAGWLPAGHGKEVLHATWSGILSLTARFEPHGEGAVVVNEINYHAPTWMDTDDWVELLNPGGSTMYLAGWTLTDANENVYTFGESERIPAGGYHLLCSSPTDFLNVHGPGLVCNGALGFRLGNSGDALVLRDAAGAVVDSVRYEDTHPWSPLADGHGYTLELKDPDLDNALASSWTASASEGGTPGRTNSAYTSTRSSTEGIGQEDGLGVYPNPSRGRATFTFTLAMADRVRLDVFDPMGRVVARVVDGVLPAGRFEFQWTPDGLASGAYYGRLHIGESVVTTTSVILTRP